ncbi:MAG: hypothetical protein A2460_07010 [Omnitrophica WOR_2 bacterium RIFOXYC2_FULL_43_9]|nr:MAG: hypothetical protein A2460_07010 [Omnitrophica WOR_2 bacterium RIFOXYC2_FULL_43_9]
MQVYDIAIIGAGPAGTMAAIRSGQLEKNILLIERNNSIGRKILLSGKGRCNVTNILSLEEFITKFGRRGAFLRSAFSKFFNQELIDFFKAKGLDLKVERQGRVFPVTDRAASIVEVLMRYLLENKVTIVYATEVIEIKKEKNSFRLFFAGGRQTAARRVILATGGSSFSFTGSRGNGFTIARKVGHTIVPLMPGLVPLRTEEAWVKGLQGLTLKNIRLTFTAGNKKITSDIGELLFTHFGVSGPLILDLSSSVLELFERDKKVSLCIDLKPGLTPVQLEDRLLREFRDSGGKNIKNVLKGILPLKLIEVFVNLLRLDYNKKSNQVTKEERRAMVSLLKSFCLRITGSLPIEEAMVTCGGVSTKEIDPRTMESRFVAGLYFAGEIIDASASSGGYNLQQAFSTGYLAGESAAVSMKTSGHQDTRTPGHQDTRTPGHQDTRTPGHQDTRTPGHQVTRTPGHQDTRSPGHQDTRKRTSPFFSLVTL